MKPSGLLNLVTISLGLFLVQSFSASAGTITFNDATETLSLTDTTGRASIVGCVSSPEVCAINLIGPEGGTGNPSWTNGALNIFEQDGQTISDTLSGTQLTDTSFFFVFESDPTTAFPTGARSMIEDGTFQEFGSITWTDQNNAVLATDILQFQSDIDSPTGIPEPISLTLFGAELIVVGALRRRSFRT